MLWKRIFFLEKVRSTWLKTEYAKHILHPKLSDMLLMEFTKRSKKHIYVLCTTGGGETIFSSVHI
jgi:hypothetical protein